MEPNINQPEGLNPIPQPVVQAAPSPEQPVAPATPQILENPKKGIGKRMILLVILLLLIVGMVAYILFAKNQMNNNQKTTTDYNSLILPTPTTTPTLAPQDDLEVGSPEADLSELDADAKGL